MAYELQSAKLQAEDNMEFAQQLFNLLQVACSERDEARYQLQELMMTMNKEIIQPEQTPSIIPSLDQDFFCKISRVLQHCQSPESPLLLIQGNVNSSITESNNSALSETQTYSSPIDPFSDPVSAAELSTINSITNSGNSTLLNQPTLLKYPGEFSGLETPIPSKALSFASASPDIDQDDLVIYSLAKGRALPQKGRLLLAVIAAGPLLQTLMVAGPLPRWRNPPPTQTFRAQPGGLDVVNDGASSPGMFLYGRAMFAACGISSPVSPVKRRRVYQ